MPSRKWKPLADAAIRKLIRPIRTVYYYFAARGDLSTILFFQTAMSALGLRFAKIERKKIKAQIQLLKKGWDLPDKLQHEPRSQRATSVPRVLYLLHNSLPHDHGGYATRSHGILKSVQKQQCQIFGVTRLGYPSDRHPHRGEPPRHEVVDGIDYFRLIQAGSDLNTHTLPEYLERYLDALRDLSKSLNPTVIHACSNFFNGIVGLSLAREQGLPFVYEVRGLWELTLASRHKGYLNSKQYRMYSNLETQVCQNSDKVFTLTEALRDILVRRGVSAEKIELLPNSVDTEYFKPIEKNKSLFTSLSLPEGKRIIGYIGSLVDYEGLDFLIQAVATMEQKARESIFLLIVGDGPMGQALRKLAKKLLRPDQFLFTGPVSHEEIQLYYSLFDLMVYPRVSLPVTEAVSPIKPLEAMAMGKPILASSVRALAEIIRNEKFLFKPGSATDLAQALTQITTQNSLAEVCHQNSLWIRQYRDWNKISGKIVSTYVHLLTEWPA